MFVWLGQDMIYSKYFSLLGSSLRLIVANKELIKNKNINLQWHGGSSYPTDSRLNWNFVEGRRNTRECEEKPLEQG